MTSGLCLAAAWLARVVAGVLFLFGVPVALVGVASVAWHLWTGRDPLSAGIFGIVGASMVTAAWHADGWATAVFARRAGGRAARGFEVVNPPDPTRSA